MATSLKELIRVLRDSELPYGEWAAQFSALHARMPQKLDAIFLQVVERAKSRKGEFPAKKLRKTLDKFFTTGDVELLKSALLPLTKIMNRYSEGLKVHELSVFPGLMEQYWSIEKLLSVSVLFWG